MTLKKIVYVLVPILLVFTLVIAGSSCASNKNYRYKPPKKKKTAIVLTGVIIFRVKKKLLPFRFPVNI